MERAYAQALWNVIEGGVQTPKALHALHESLKKSGRESLLPRIAKAFARLAAQASLHTRITLTVADMSHHDAALKEATSHMTHLSKNNVTTHVDNTIIGGWRLEGHETLIDTSYKKHLLAIYKKAAQF